MPNKHDFPADLQHYYKEQQDTYVAINQYLLGGIPTPLKNMSSSIGMIIPHIRKNMENKRI